MWTPPTTAQFKSDGRLPPRARYGYESALFSPFLVFACASESTMTLWQQPTDKGSYSPAQWHWKFVAAYFGVALVYFAGGYVYNYKVYGLSGRDAFLHSQFWFVDLRGLVTDGCYYSIDLAKVQLARSCNHLARMTRWQAAHARLHKCCTGQDLPETSEYAYSRAPTFEADVDQD
jgi:hypothetical protein